MWYSKLVNETKQNIKEAKTMKTKTRTEKEIIGLIEFVEKEKCFIVDKEIAESGEEVFHLSRGDKFNAMACSIFFAEISKYCLQYTEMKIGRFWHIVWNFENIVIMFWDC